MNAQTNHIIQKAEEAVRRLLQECRKDGPLYGTNTRATAQVSRTSKWLLSAISQLGQQAPSSTEEDQTCN